MSTLSAIHGTSTRHADDWRTRAACLRVDPEMMFPDRSDDDGNEIALRICSRCPLDVVSKCRAEALANDERYGVWGGTTEAERQGDHGTIAKYRQGCKCRRCRSAKSAYNRTRDGGRRTARGVAS